MSESFIDWTFTVELKPGEQLTLPPAIVEQVGPGRWIVTIRLCGDFSGPQPIRRHDAFLSGYASEDEGLYIDLAT
jgi:hypothetical protein